MLCGSVSRRLRRLLSGRTAACSAISTDGVDSPISGYLIHPSILDNAFQAGAVIEEDGIDKNETYVPASVKVFAFSKSLGASKGTINSVAEAKANLLSDGTIRDHCIINSSGRLLVHVVGLEAKPMRSQGRKRFNKASYNDVMYTVQRQVTALFSVEEVQSLNTTMSAKYSDSLTSHMANFLATLQSVGDASGGVSLYTVHGQNVCNLHSSGDWGMIRSFAAEHPSIHVNGYLIDSHVPVNGGTARLSTDSKAVQGADVYGAKVGAGISERAVLLSSSKTQSAPRFHMVPRPRGAFNNLVAKVVEVDQLQPGKVEMEVKAIGINFRDVLNVLGMYPGDPGDPGGDCAGVISRVYGDDCRLHPGQPVFGLAAGSLGSYVKASELTLVPIPEGLTFQQAASMPTVFITVETALNKIANIQPGETLLVHAAAGGVGLAAIQMATAKGASTVSTAGSSNKRALVRSLGVQHAFNSRNIAYASEISCMQPVHVVLNSLTSSGMVAGTLATMSLGGKFVEISKRDIWASLRVAQERPDISYSLLAVDFMPEIALNAALTSVSKQAAMGNLVPLPFINHDIRNVTAALRQMSQARHTGKIVVSSVSLKQRQSVSADNAIAITGGLGTLGFQVASWLADQQAQHIILMGRSGRRTSTIESSFDSKISGIYGSLCTAVACDSSVRADLASGLNQNKVLGIMHAGGILRDAIFSAQSSQLVSAVFGSKVSSAILINKTIQLHPLAFQTMFSSVAALLGSPGQANYSAANSILDAIAESLQDVGVSSSSVQWGAWAGAGMASNDASTQMRVERTGMGLLEPSQGLEVLGGIILSSRYEAVTAVNVFVWDKLAKRFKTERPELFKNFIISSESKKQASQPSGSSGAHISAETIQSEVMDAIKNIIGSEVPVEESLMSAGLDSLGAVELKNALESRMGVQLPGTLVFDYPTASALSAFLETQVVVSDMEETFSAHDITQSELPVGIATEHSPLALISAAAETPVLLLDLELPDGISKIPFERWDVEFISQQYAPARFGGYLQAIDQFDVDAFGFSMAEALLIDAQQRILLSLAKEVSSPD